MAALFFYQGRADNQPENGTAMIAAARAFLPPVLRETVPETGSGTRFEGMGANPRDARPPACVATTLSRLLKEIDAAPRPIHSPCIIRERARASKMLLKVGKQLVKRF